MNFLREMPCGLSRRNFSLVNLLWGQCHRKQAHLRWSRAYQGQDPQGSSILRPWTRLCHHHHTKAICSCLPIVCGLWMAPVAQQRIWTTSSFFTSLRHQWWQTDKKFFNQLARNLKMQIIQGKHCTWENSRDSVKPDKCAFANYRPKRWSALRRVSPHRRARILSRNWEPNWYRAEQILRPYQGSSGVASIKGSQGHVVRIPCPCLIVLPSFFYLILSRFWLTCYHCSHALQTDIAAWSALVSMKQALSQLKDDVTLSRDQHNT